MSLYLKYRPKDFDSLVGQEFIKKTLQTALREEKIVSSYLLCGPR
jgi:DNA polymerase III subunit gamma/tau